MRTLRTATLLVLIPLVPLHAADQRPSKPNILHIHADDHRPDGLHSLGTPLLQTPNLDSLVDRGMSFTHCYTMGSMTGAVCTPSRTMMLTGRSWQRIPGAPAAASNASDASTFLPRVVASAGYQTWHMGKEGNGYPAGLRQFETSITDDAKGSTPETDRAHSSQRAIRGERWKLIRYPLVDRTQLFDLNADPHELSNLADMPEHKAKVAEMTELLQKEMTRYSDTFPLTVADPKPAEWSPPADGGKSKKKAKEKS